MITVTHLQNALTSVRQQREVLAAIEKNLISTIGFLSAIEVPVKETHAKKTLVSEVREILVSAGGPLHITAIASRLAAVKGRMISRQQIEPGLIRHCKIKYPKIAKVGPSTFSLKP